MEILNREKVTNFRRQLAIKWKKEIVVNKKKIGFSF